MTEPRSPQQAPDADDDLVDLAAPEHLWWSETQDYVAIVDAPEHLWWAGPSETLPPLQTTRSFDAVPLTGVLDPPSPDGNGAAAPASTGPYAVLRVPNDATWDEIVAAYRRQVRWWHPDGLGDAPAVERDACDARLRDLNQAFTELKIRRSRA
jgi:DnaJ-class molecular chaperone